jgi:hypothetical protein
MMGFISMVVYYQPELAWFASFHFIWLRWTGVVALSDLHLQWAQVTLEKAGVTRRMMKEQTLSQVDLA